MATATLKPHLESGGIEGSEVESYVTSATAHYLVVGLTATDTSIIEEALNATNIPANASYMPGNTNLIVTRRDVRINSQDPTKAEVSIQYQSIGEANATFIFSGGTSLTQINTQTDRYGNQITVSHTYGSDPDPEYSGQTLTQGGDLPVLMPQTTLTATGRLPVAYPLEVSQFWVGSMNGNFWASGNPYTWLCTRADFRAIDLALTRPAVWEFTFEFQHKLDTWIPYAFFVDPRTGKPPAGIVIGTGTKLIDWYGIIDFNVIFGNT
jgi:hypothetical protein